MKREDLLALVANVIADEVAIARADLAAHVEQAIAAKPVPPFTSPPLWTAGRHGAGTVVRHRNGVFSARRDTTDEPPADAWLPLLVGVAGVDMTWQGDRTLFIRATLSDGAEVVVTNSVALPIVRGYWLADAQYHEGDRVFRFGEYHALQSSYGVEPGTDAAADTWLKVGGKATPKLQLAIDNDGTWTESGRPIGTVKPLIATLLQDTVDGAVKRLRNGG